MSKRLIMILTLVFVAGIAFAAYAEVQNVKVSGDLIISGVGRNEFDLTDGIDGNRNDDSESIFMSQIRLRVDADLTDNVMATLRLINERNWTYESGTSTDIDLDLAYVTLKEFLYSPLSLRLGRQEIRYGNGLIIGNSRNYNTSNVTTIFNGVPTDLSTRKAFDAIKATLNYDPLTVDVLYAKINEGSGRGTVSAGENDDVDLYGIYGSYAVTKNLTADLYGFFKDDSTTDKNDRIYTIGTLLSATPIQNLKASLELAMQLGKHRTSRDTRQAYALQAMVDYTLSKVKYTPMLGIAYTYLSGDTTQNNGKKAWNQMYYDQALNNITYALIPFTNLNVINLKGSVKPMEDVTLAVNYGYYLRAKRNATDITSPNYDSDGALYSSTHTSYAMTSKKQLGNAVDVTATYDYTEDVQLGLTCGWFQPGKAFAERNRRNANQVIGSMKVTF